METETLADNIETTIEAELAKITVKTDAEIEAARAGQRFERVKALRRASCCPIRAVQWLVQREGEAKKNGRAIRDWMSGSVMWDAARKALVEIAQREAGATVVIIGNQGRGKTTLAVDLVRFVTAGERSAKWGDVVGFVIAMQDAKQLGYQQREFREWEDPQLLVLDQADKLPGVDWENRLLFRLLNQRHDAQRLTVLICNPQATERVGMGAEMAHKLGSSVWDRVRETGLVIYADWPPVRPSRLQVDSEVRCE